MSSSYRIVTKIFFDRVYYQNLPLRSVLNSDYTMCGAEPARSPLPYFLKKTTQFSQDSKLLPFRNGRISNFVTLCLRRKNSPKKVLRLEISDVDSSKKFQIPRTHLCLPCRDPACDLPA